MNNKFILQRRRMKTGSDEFEFQTDRNNYTDLRQRFLSLVVKLGKHCGIDPFKKGVKKEHNEAEDKKTDVDDNEVPLIIHVNNIVHSLFSNMEVLKTTSKFTIQMDFMLFNLTFPTNLKEPTLSIRECYIVKVMTLKQIQKTLWITP